MGRLRLAERYLKPLTLAMCALAGLMLLDLLHQTWAHITWRSWISEASAGEHGSASPASQPSDGAATKSASPRGSPVAETHAAIRKRNIFAEARPKGHGLRLTGVLGSIALFSAREGGALSIEEGKSERGVKVKSIAGYEVVIEYEGKEEKMNLFTGGGSRGGPPEAGAFPGPGGPGMPIPEDVMRRMMERRSRP